MFSSEICEIFKSTLIYRALPVGAFESVLKIFALSIIMAIIFWQFTVFPCKFDSTQVKQILISSTINFVHELPHMLPNNLILRKLGNNSKMILSRVQSPTSNSLSLIQFCLILLLDGLRKREIMVNHGFTCNLENCKDEACFKGLIFVNTRKILKFF